MITETGAEANRDGPVEEKGTYAFQQDFANFHFGVYASKPWLSAARSAGRCRSSASGPDWDGGNPRPPPPLHQKGLIDFDGDARSPPGRRQRIFKATASSARVAPAGVPGARARIGYIPPPWHRARRPS